jgi:acyl-CoA synthetase (NDP forming)
MQPEDQRQHLSIGEERIPTYRFPNAAARAIGRSYDYHQWRQNTRDHAPRRPTFEDVNTERARDLCRSAVDGKTPWLDIRSTNSVLDAVGISTTDVRLTNSADEAVEAANNIGYPVVLKMSSRTLLQKSHWDGLRVGLSTETEVQDAYEAIRGKLSEAGRLEELEGVAVQRHVEGDLELMAGMTEDEVFGPLVTFGLGGTHYELLEDVSVRITPLTTYDAERMLTEIKGSALLEGYRGSPPADRTALKELLLRLSILAKDVPEITKIDLNPIKVFSPDEGYTVLDAHIRVGNRS